MRPKPTVRAFYAYLYEKQVKGEDSRLAGLMLIRANKHIDTATAAFSATAIVYLIRPDALNNSHFIIATREGVALGAHAGR